MLHTKKAEYSARMFLLNSVWCSLVLLGSGNGLAMAKRPS